MVARIETASHPGCTFRRLLRNKDQSKPHALTSYKRYTLTAPKHNKNNDFRLIIGRLSQKGKNNLKLLFARPRLLTYEASRKGGVDVRPDFTDHHRHFVSAQQPVPHSIPLAHTV